MSTLLVVMAHAGAQLRFNLHLRYWESHGQDMLVMCPQDAMIQTDHDVIAIGRKSHHDAEANRRFRCLLELLNKLHFDRFIIHEYDSLCLAPQHPDVDPEVFHGNCFENNDRSFFKETQFFHPPLMFGKRILERLVEVSRGVPDSAQGGFWDRQVGLYCDIGKIPKSGYGHLGFSKNTIEPHDIPAAVAARKAGACLFHGVKTGEVLINLLAA